MADFLRGVLFGGITGTVFGFGIAAVLCMGKRADEQSETQYVVQRTKNGRFILN